jgi:hypothetical protein
MTEEKAARRILADADRKLACLEQALEAGLSTATFVRLARQHEVAHGAAKPSWPTCFDEAPIFR